MICHFDQNENKNTYEQQNSITRVEFPHLFYIIELFVVKQKITEYCNM